MPRALPEAADAARKWKEGMERLATETKAQAMVDAITVNPMTKAADQADHWFNRVSAPEAKVRFQKRLRKAAGDIEGYKKLTKAGVLAIRLKLPALEDKMKAKYEPMLAHMRTVLTTVRAMPTGKGPYETSPNIKRFEAYTKGMMKYKDRD